MQLFGKWSACVSALALGKLRLRRANENCDFGPTRAAIFMVRSSPLDSGRLPYDLLLVKLSPGG